MSISHWGIFPGWFEPKYEPGDPVGGVYSGVPGVCSAEFRPASWQEFCRTLELA